MNIILSLLLLYLNVFISAWTFHSLANSRTWIDENETKTNLLLILSVVLTVVYLSFILV